MSPLHITMFMNIGLVPFLFMQPLLGETASQSRLSTPFSAMFTDSQVQEL